jgi:LytS/YehU family sensor histidine kinase
LSEHEAVALQRRAQLGVSPLRPLHGQLQPHFLFDVHNAGSAERR